MIIFLDRTEWGSRNGHTIETFAGGRSYRVPDELPRTLARAFLQGGSASLGEDPSGEGPLAAADFDDLADDTSDSAEPSETQPGLANRRAGVGPAIETSGTQPSDKSAQKRLLALAKAREARKAGPRSQSGAQNKSLSQS